MGHSVDFSPMRPSRVPATLAYLLLGVHVRSSYGLVGVSPKRVIIFPMHVVHGYVAWLLFAL
jgi:hypothetical protein